MKQHVPQTEFDLLSTDCLSITPMDTTRETFILDLTCRLLRSPRALTTDDGATIIPGLALVNVFHYFHLPTLDLQDRAQPLMTLVAGAARKLCAEFLTPLFFTATALLVSGANAGLDYDFDGRVFLATAAYLSQNDVGELDDSQMVGVRVAEHTRSLWRQANPALKERKGTSVHAELRDIMTWLGRPTLPGVAQGSFDGQGPQTVDADTSTMKLLPFNNPVLSKHLPLVERTSHSLAVSQAGSSAYLHFGSGEGTMFSDTRHWHNQKSILPPHLGGEKPAPRPPPSTTVKPGSKYTEKEWMEMKRLRKHQQFMSDLQSQAATITGAAGGILRQTIIPSVGFLVGGSRNVGVRSVTEKVSRYLAVF